MESITNVSFSALNDLKIIQEIDILKKEIDARRPLAKDVEARIMQKLRLEWNYNSNAIEGNSLDYGETVALLMHGVTAKGKPLKDYFDIEGHNLVIDYLTHFIQHGDELTEKEIRGMHEMLLIKPYENLSKTEDGRTVQRKIHLGEYKRMPNHVETRTGQIHYYATPEDTSFLMHDLVNWYRNASETAELHPLVIASVFHHQFTAIHPFDDGNGRMSRLLMNLILMRFGYPPAVIKNNEKDEYFSTLSQADVGIYEPFTNYIGSALISSLNVYVRGLNGENLDEPGDFQKKVLLFKKELEARRDKIEVKRSLEVQQAVLSHSITPFVDRLTSTVRDLKDLFLSYSENLLKYDTESSKWSYERIHLSNGIEEFFNTEFKKTGSRVFNLGFENFKLASNPFSVDLNIYIALQDYNYIIRYGILDGSVTKESEISQMAQWLRKDDLISKYYHQVISEDEIRFFVTRIANYMLDCIKELLENPTPPAPEMIEIVKAWEYAIFKNENISEDEKNTLILRDMYSIRIFEYNVDIEVRNSIDPKVRAIIARDMHHYLYQNNYLANNNLISVSNELPF